MSLDLLLARWQIIDGLILLYLDTRAAGVLHVASLVFPKFVRKEQPDPADGS
jgi:hypothetical protein